MIVYAHIHAEQLYAMRANNKFSELALALKTFVESPSLEGWQVWSDLFVPYDHQVDNMLRLLMRQYPQDLAYKALVLLSTDAKMRWLQGTASVITKEQEAWIENTARACNGLRLYLEEEEPWRPWVYAWQASSLWWKEKTRHPAWLHHVLSIIPESWHIILHAQTLHGVEEEHLTAWLDTLSYDAQRILGLILSAFTVPEKNKEVESQMFNSMLRTPFFGVYAHNVIEQYATQKRFDTLRGFLQLVEPHVSHVLNARALVSTVLNIAYAENWHVDMRSDILAWITHAKDLGLYLAHEQPLVAYMKADWNCLHFLPIDLYPDVWKHGVAMYNIHALRKTALRKNIESSLRMHACNTLIRLNDEEGPLYALDEVKNDNWYWTGSKLCATPENGISRELAELALLLLARHAGNKDATLKLVLGNARSMLQPNEVLILCQETMASHPTVSWVALEVCILQQDYEQCFFWAQYALENASHELSKQLQDTLRSCVHKKDVDGLHQWLVEKNMLN